MEELKRLSRGKSNRRSIDTQIEVSVHFDIQNITALSSFVINAGSK
jgi:hypothetical protein